MPARVRTSGGHGPGRRAPNRRASGRIAPGRIVPRLAAALVVALLVAVGAVACGSSGLKVGLAYAIGGPGDDGFNDLALAGLNRAQKQLSGSISSVRALTARSDETPEDQYRRLTLLCESGYDPVIAVGFTYAGDDPSDSPLARAAKDCPHTRFGIVDDDSVRAGNVANLVFADQQGAYLMGIVAAEESVTGTIGLVGACDVPVVDRFLAGYQAGADRVRPGVRVLDGYASSDPSSCDFTDPGPARTAAARLYAQGADVVFQVAGGAGTGVFQAAVDSGAKAIGVDTDQYRTAPPQLRPVILTSLVKRVDVAVYDFIDQVVAHRFRAGVTRYDLADDGLEYATSGGRITDLVPVLDAYRKKIISGAIVVPASSR